MRIAVDAMGGDHAPQAIVEGALQAAKTLPNIHILLVGDESKIIPLLGGKALANIEIIHASEVITPDEKEPAKAIRRKKDSSMAVALDLVKDRQADGVISAGNTGAFMSGGVFKTKRIEGVERPALAPILPTLEGTGTLVLDVGANMDAKPEHLLQYAIMGNIYARDVMAIAKPRIGLLNVGTEELKGNELTKEAFALFEKQSFHFIGNIEARDIPFGVCDVVICDGFSGNILLKSMEGIANAVFQVMKDEFSSSLISKFGAALLKPSLRGIKRKMDYTEYGGAPLLGLQGTCIKAHGSSNAHAVKNAIVQAARFIEKDVIGHINKEVKPERGERDAQT
ncbi:phosphate acyltransferase PlsX [Ammoniphilus sp. CFH 90114]|uniref:phosphate acyltransferase PlsX n=1 Tax=Ammoniphilus sp. CFH 90114 TaxID=2493665 RepID=UPI00100EFCCD|nr:phosphate acyltransferase PlsX [Ammoniphilus sp. CFH 90114]RXT15075.1 phosphate acyltransferase PlsX [Ammoniphilus sp. CFH 90114]